jgi:hypothetical protein
MYVLLYAIGIEDSFVELRDNTKKPDHHHARTFE